MEAVGASGTITLSFSRPGSAGTLSAWLSRLGIVLAMPVIKPVHGSGVVLAVARHSGINKLEFSVFLASVPS